jgi:hypothetical protein
MGSRTAYFTLRNNLGGEPLQKSSSVAFRNGGRQSDDPPPKWRIEIPLGSSSSTA